MSHATLAATNLAIRPALSNHRRRRGHCGCPASVRDGRTRAHVVLGGSRGSGDDAVVAGDATAPVELSRRNAIVAAVAALTGASAAAPASAGEILKQLEDLLADTEAAIETDPENESLLGQRTFFENQLERVQANSTYLDRLAPKVQNASTGYLQRLVLVVDKDLFDDEVYFWKNAMGMRVTRERTGVDNVGRTVVFAYGQETLRADDGGKSGVEIREAPVGREGTLGNGLGYVSVAVPYGIRVSRIYEAGGELVYGFGYFDVRSPSGYAVRARVAARRDSMELVAVNVVDVKAAERYYVDTFGMVARAPLDENGYAPKSPPGSRLLTFGDAKETMGLLLQPLAAAVDEGENLDTGNVYGGIVVVADGAKAPAGYSTDTAGYGVTTEGYEAWESEVADGGKSLDSKWNAPLEQV